LKPVKSVPEVSGKYDKYGNIINIRVSNSTDLTDMPVKTDDPDVHTHPGADEYKWVLDKFTGFPGKISYQQSEKDRIRVLGDNNLHVIASKYGMAFFNQHGFQFISLWKDTLNQK
jgi:hypothetical protein